MNNSSPLVVWIICTGFHLGGAKSPRTLRPLHWNAMNFLRGHSLFASNHFLSTCFTRLFLLRVWYLDNGTGIVHLWSSFTHCHPARWLLLVPLFPHLVWDPVLFMPEPGNRKCIGEKVCHGAFMECHTSAKTLSCFIAHWLPYWQRSTIYSFWEKIWFPSPV